MTRQDPVHVHTCSLQSAGETKAGRVSVTAKEQVRATPDVATGQTAFVVVLPINLTKLKSLFWLTNQPVTITPYDGESAGTPIVLAADQALVWFLGCGWACPLAADVTVVKVANASGETAAMDLDNLVDPTLDT